MSAKRLQMSIDAAKIQKFFYSPKKIRISFIFQTKRKFKKDTLLGDTLVFDKKKRVLIKKDVIMCIFAYHRTPQILFINNN